MAHTNCTGIAENIEREWFAFRVRPRHEKAVALQLRDKRENCFLPLVVTARIWAKRVVQVELPLFSGYVFCHSHRFGLLPVLKTPGVIDVVRAGSCPVPIPAEEINAFVRVVRASVQIEPCPYAEVGQKVMIQSGPLAGLTGIVDDTRKPGQVVLSVTLLRRSVLVHIDATDIAERAACGAERTACGALPPVHGVRAGGILAATL